MIRNIFKKVKLKIDQKQMIMLVNMIKKTEKS